MLAFEPQNDKEQVRFQVVGEWKLKGTSFAEGMAYVPDNGGGKLYISDEVIDAKETNIRVYDISPAILEPMAIKTSFL